MGFITSDYYFGAYGGAETADDIDTLIDRAGEIIDILTGGKITGAGGIEKLPDYAAERVKCAVAAEVDYLDRNGGLSSLDSSTPVQMTLGRFSYMNGAGTSERRSFPVSAMAEGFLELSGLLSRNIDIC